MKEEKEQSELLGIIAEKVSEESCTEQCESCQKYCPASEECMATDENVRCTKCEYLCEACGICELEKIKKASAFRQVNLLIPGTVRRVQKNTQYQQATPLDYHTVFLSGSPAAACQGESLKPSENEKGEVTMLKFICGVLVGGIIGVVLMCLLQINKIQ